MIADGTPARQPSRPIIRNLEQIADTLKPGNLRARFKALNAPQRTMVVLIAALFAIVLTTFNRYGFTFDEFKGVLRAKAVLDFLKLSGKTSHPSGIDVTHGAAPDLIALFLQKLIPPLSFNSRHLVFALFGVAGIYYVYRFGSKFIGEWVGVFAALFLAGTPMWFGYMFINAKDVPFATLLLASSYYSLLVLTGHETSRGLWVNTGLAVGLLAATKLAGLAALLLIIVVYLACFVGLPSQNGVKIASDLGRRIASLALAGLLGCLLCFLLFWPQVYVLDVAFREPGKSILSAHEDPYYAARYFIVSTPVFLLVLAAAGTMCAIYRREATIIAAIVIFILFFLIQALSGVRVYNGCRHFLFVYPFFMLTAAYPVAFALDILTGSLARIVLIGAVALCLAGTIVEMYRLFPYQYSFYNSLVGGFVGADGVYEIDTWRAAHREAIDLIAAKVKPGDTVRVRSCASKIDLKLHPGFKLVDRNEAADYFVALRRGKKCAASKFEGLPVVGEVRREGVLLARVYAAR